MGVSSLNTALAGELSISDCLIGNFLSCSSVRSVAEISARCIFWIV